MCTLTKVLPRRAAYPLHQSFLNEEKRKAVAISDSILRGMEGPMHQPDPAHGELHWLPGTHTRGITQNLPGLVWPLIISLYWFSMEAVTRSQQEGCKQSRGISGPTGQGIWSTSWFISVPPVPGNNGARETWTSWSRSGGD